MERKSMTKKQLEEFATKATSDNEQKLWEKKVYGTDARYVGRSDHFKPASKLISIRVPEDVLEGLKEIADNEGLRYQTYLISLLKKHVRRKQAG